ncbi:BTAD domain-containing putative transcriptional regulator [Nocardia harenae]|uniref:BTAD domain-containing putative transcriptional regulator n=1 Tax=Nocardia harenae TaxID=358707 RepID=UPI00082ABC66|nr:BTAD domain-containing putative transcriptional regulator [Nocardia harenae]
MLEIRVLGEPRLGDRPFPGGRPGLLLALLVLARGRVVSVPRLVAELWPESEPGDPRAALHTTVARLRRLAVGPVLRRSDAGYCLDREGVALDADEFASRTVVPVGESPAAALARWESALELWGGEPWGRFAAGPAYAEAAELRERFDVAREERAGALLELGRGAEVVAELRALLAAAPLRERRVRLLIEALTPGDQVEALRVYDEYRRALADELGLDPSPTLVALHGRVLRHEMGVPGGAMRDGTARSAPTELPRSGGGPSSDRAGTRGPAPRPLIGRDAQLTAVNTLLDLHRAVTVVGPGGVGKTSLAAVVAAGHRHWWADLAAVTTAGSVARTVADAIGVEVRPGAVFETALRHRLAELDGLLVLDNCEHLLGASAAVAELALTASADLRVLATSRQRLGIAAEQVSPLPPLQLPDPDSAAAPAVTLFLECATAAAPEFAACRDDFAVRRAVAALVRRLDGLPLAIELAAGRLGALTLDDLATHLTHRLDLLRAGSPLAARRQRTLAATIAWSCDLLEPAEARAFRRLAVFAREFDLAAATAVLAEVPGTVGLEDQSAEADSPGSDTAELVARLAERSLLVRPGPTGTGRYRMLETLRTFVHTETPAGERVAARRAHAAWLVAAVEDADDGLRGPDEPRWSLRLDDLVPDAAVAFRWALDAEPATACRIVTAYRHWSYLRLRADILGWALEIDEREASSGVHAAATLHHWLVGNAAEARARGAAALAAAEPGSRAESVALDALSDQALADGEFATVDELNTRAHTLALARGDHVAATLATVALTLAAAYSGRPADPLLARAAAEARRSGNPTSLAWVAYTEGELHADTDPARALTALETATTRAESVHNRIIAGVSRTAATAVRARTAPLNSATLADARAAVDYWSGAGSDQLLRTCLRNLVPLLDRLGAAAGLVELAAATGVTDAAGTERLRLDAALARAREALGAAFGTSFAAGERRTLAAAAEALIGVLDRSAAAPR